MSKPKVPTAFELFCLPRFMQEKLALTCAKPSAKESGL